MRRVALPLACSSRGTMDATRGYPGSRRGEHLLSRTMQLSAGNHLVISRINVYRLEGMRATPSMQRSAYALAHSGGRFHSRFVIEQKDAACSSLNFIAQTYFVVIGDTRGRSSVGPEHARASQRAIARFPSVCGPMSSKAKCFSSSHPRVQLL